MQGKKTLVVAILAVVLLAIPLVSFAASGPGKGGNQPPGCAGPGELTFSLPTTCTNVPSGLGVDGRFRADNNGVALEMRVDVSGACNSFDPATGAHGDDCQPPGIGVCLPLDATGEALCNLTTGYTFGLTGGQQVSVGGPGNAQIVPDPAILGGYIGSLGFKLKPSLNSVHWQCTKKGDKVRITAVAVGIDIECTWQ